MSIDQVVELNDLDRDLYERLLGRALHDVREHLDERISREQLERVLLTSEAHPYDLLEALQHLALIVGNDEPCPHCGDFDCTEDHQEPTSESSLTQTADCPFCAERYTVWGQRLAPEHEASLLNQCATCAQLEARGSSAQEYSTHDWQPDDRVVLVTHD